MQYLSESASPFSIPRKWRPWNVPWRTSRILCSVSSSMKWITDTSCWTTCEQICWKSWMYVKATENRPTISDSWSMNLWRDSCPLRGTGEFWQEMNQWSLKVTERAKDSFWSKLSYKNEGFCFFKFRQYYLHFNLKLPRKNVGILTRRSWGENSSYGLSWKCLSCTFFL